MATLRLADLVGLEFTQARDVAWGKIWSKITHQPGYRRGQTMRLARTTAGGIRLYVLVDNRWIDASLQDMAL